MELLIWPSQGAAMLCLAHLSLTSYPLSSMSKWGSWLDAEQVREGKGKMGLILPQQQSICMAPSLLCNFLDQKMYLLYPFSPFFTLTLQLRHAAKSVTPGNQPIEPWVWNLGMSWVNLELLRHPKIVLSSRHVLWNHGRVDNSEIQS